MAVPEIGSESGGKLVSITLLGPFRLIKGGVPLLDLPVKASALLAFLAMQSDPTSREALAELIWPDREKEQSRQSLRQAISSIRRSLGDIADQVIKTNRGGPGISLYGVSVDANQLANINAVDGLDTFTRRAKLCRGEFLAGFPSISNPFDEWVLLQRSKASNAAACILGKLASLQMQHGHFDAAIETGQQLISLDPLREDSHRLLMEMYAKMGRRAEALRQYEACAQILRTELNVDPDAETKGLAKRLRRETPADHRSTADIRQQKETAESGSKDGSKVFEPQIEIAPAQSPIPILQAERKQLTVMVCRITNARELSAELDPEDFRRVTDNFRMNMEEIVRRFGGTTARHTDDGIVAYFGHPYSHEDDAERAVRAALEAVGAHQNKPLAPSSKLNANAGVASGLVVVDQTAMAATPRFASGAAPYLAAQIQSQARAGEVMISESTKKQLGRLFDLEEVTEKDGTGLGSPANAYRVLCDRAIESRFKALRADRLTPFIGRDEELDLLARRWDQVSSGEGRAVLLSGEPGIGKSRIIHRFKEGLKGKDHARLSYYCSSLHTHSFLYPFRVRIERHAGIVGSDSFQLRLEKIERMWEAVSEGRRTNSQIIADLVGIQEGVAEAGKGSDPQYKEIILKTLLDFAIRSAQRKPLLVVLEDAHWADPTSLELIERLVSQISHHRIMLLVSARPEFQPGWFGASSVTLVSLSRLAKPESKEIIASVTSWKRLPDELVLQVLAQAEGVPLYLEELTRSILESGKLIESASGFDLSGKMTPLELPDSLQSSLVARLDRVISAKKIAQVGAVIGSIFPHELLEEVVRLELGQAASGYKRAHHCRSDLQARWPLGCRLCLQACNDPGCCL